MRQLVFLILGLLEFTVALMLVFLGTEIPSRSEVERGFGRIEAVTERTGAHVHLLRRQVNEFRRPELLQLAGRLETETRTVTRTLRDQKVDFDKVRTLSDALGDVSTGLDGLSQTLNPRDIGKLGEGLGATASYLDEKVAASAGKAAGQLDETTAALQRDARKLATLLREAPPDLKAAREIHDGLGRFSEGLEKMGSALKLQRFDTMKEGFQGLETSLSTGADQVERLAGYTYPKVTITGLKPMVEQRPFWPEGDKIAAGMRKAADGATAARKEMDSLASELPKLRNSLDESRKVAEKTREALGLALKQQGQVELLLKDVPTHAARLADELPKLAQDLARILRDTENLKEVASSLRQAQKGIDTAVAKWPELRTTLSRSATVLRSLQQQLQQTVEHRSEYEAALRQTIVLADAFATLLPLITEQMEQRLQDQDRALSDLSQSIDEANQVLPAYEQSTARVFEAGRWLAWLVAAIVALHGGYLVLGARLGKAYGG